MKYFASLFCAYLIVIVTVGLVHASLIGKNMTYSLNIYHKSLKTKTLEHSKYRFFPNHVRNSDLLKGNNLRMGILQAIPGELAHNITRKYEIFLIDIKFSVIFSSLLISMNT